MIRSYDPESIVEYVPVYGGNREDSEPCVVRLRFINFAKAQEYARALAGKSNANTSPEKLTKLAQGVQRKMFVDSVESISNFYMGEIEVTEPSEFYDTADTELVIEIVEAMESQQKLQDGELKNF